RAGRAQRLRTIFEGPCRTSLDGAACVADSLYLAHWPRAAADDPQPSRSADALRARGDGAGELGVAAYGTDRAGHFGVRDLSPAALHDGFDPKWRRCGGPAP